MANQFPAVTGNSRVFIIEGGARVDHVPSFESCMRSDTVDYALGDVERIECPDPDQYGKFIEVGSIKGADSRPTTSLVSRYAIDLKSQLLTMAKKGCAADVHVHFGQCSDPSDFNEFTKAMILSSVDVTNWSTESLGALGSDENAKIDETAAISAKLIFEYTPLNYASRAADIVTTEVVDMIICDTVSCGDCEDESDGCQKIFGVTLQAGGSPGTPPDVVYSTNGGTTWYAADIDTLLTTQDASAVACLGSYLIVTSNDAGSINYAFLSEFDGVTDPAFTELTTGVVATGEPNDIWSVGNYAFLAGDAGYIYGTDDPTAGVTALESATITTDNFNAIHALSENFAVAVGNNGAVIVTENQTVWAAATRPVGAGVHLNCIWAFDEKIWFVGTNGGELYYTLNGGTTWTAKTFPGSGAGQVRDISFANDGIGYMAHDTAVPRGRILETIDGGRSWVVAPRDTKSLPLNDRITALATCSEVPDFVAGGGLADDGADGFLIIGAGS